MLGHAMHVLMGMRHDDDYTSCDDAPEPINLARLMTWVGIICFCATVWFSVLWVILS